jgi:hypothetical protein
MAFQKWREKASLSGWIGTGALKVAVYIIEVMSAKNKVTKTKTALKHLGNVQSQ